MNLGILLWNTCNAACDHCAVNSSPKEKPVMTDEQICRLIDSAFCDSENPSIGFSGGEAFAFFDRLCRILRYATAKGASVSVNTNGFWGRNYEDACCKIKILKAIPVSKLVVSIDDFHDRFLPKAYPLAVIRACKEHQLEVDLQFVATRNSSRLADLLREHGEELLNVTCREIPCHPVGRAASFAESSLFLAPRVPGGLCPSAIMSASADGRLIPYCNTAGHLKELQLGSVDDDVIAVNERFLNDPVFVVMRHLGPKAFYEQAVALGLLGHEKGHVDQCHLCHSLFVNSGSREKLRPSAEALLAEVRYNMFLRQYERNLLSLPASRLV